MTCQPSNIFKIQLEISKNYKDFKSQFGICGMCFKVTYVTYYLQTKVKRPLMLCKFCQARLVESPPTSSGTISEDTPTEGTS